MSAKPEDDQLQFQVRAVETWCKDKGIVVVSGWLPDEAHVPEVVMSADDPDRLDKFLRSLELLGVKLVAVDVSRLDAADIEARLRAFDDEDGAEADKLEVAEVRGCTKHVGQIAMLTLVALSSAPTAILRCELLAPWHDVVFPDDSDDEEEAGEVDDDDSWDDRHRALGRRVAEDPRMLGASNKHAREWVVRQVLGDEANGPSVSIFTVAQEAAAIVRLEVIPKLERRAQELRDGGAKADQIARELDIPLKLAKSLLR